ncbi:hypothetical protein SAMN02949497_0267 [Methylomagnum ishizawai]|uniref:Uncharacterized protein n=1 Tax=Methylomagnum ishizawai TaxID=1760988 RepID=A0A1Y6D4V4_9GAMM|nr:DUF5908 family protein [Methylomagnum ishizawai]SMF97697.1 hypothetical protein SAMN02949497_0267 [Methylomagnum ishizawai]
MPIEIRELIIRAVVDDAKAKSEPASDPAGPSAIDTEALVEACVRQVLKVLKQAEER